MQTDFLQIHSDLVKIKTKLKSEKWNFPFLFQNENTNSVMRDPWGGELRAGKTPWQTR